MKTEKVHFRLFKMPCCGHQLCWVNPRLPSWCPECGEQVYIRLKFHPEDSLLHENKNAVLKV